MLLTELQLFETFDNLFAKDADKRQQYAQQVFDLIQNAYAPIGGMKGSGFNSPQDMIDRIPMWKLFRRGDTVKAVMMYKDTNGRKRVAMATDGSPEAKSTIAKMLKDEYAHSRSYAEISGPSLKFHKRILGDDGLDAITIPAEQATKIRAVDPKLIRIVNQFEYQRNINGEWISKRMIGTPGKAIN